MEPSASNAILRWFVDYFASRVEDTGTGAPLGAIVYEMFGLGDAFGRVMVSNLKVRRCKESYPGKAHEMELIVEERFLAGCRSVPRCGRAPEAIPRHGFHSGAWADPT